MRRARWPAAPVCVASAQYSEPLERVAARLVAASVSAAGAVLRASSVWQAQCILRASRIGLRRAWSPLARYSEPLERVAARLVDADPRLLSVWQAQYSEPLEKLAARLVAAGPRLLFAWQAQYSEPLERVAARLVATGPRLLSVWQARKGCGAPGRRWPAASVCVAGAVFRASRKGLRGA